MTHTPAKTLAELKAQITANQTNLSKRLFQVAQYLLDHPNEIAFGTVVVIARDAGVHPSTLVRFASSFGYSGFSEMQNLFKEQLRAEAPSYNDRMRIARESEGDQADANPISLLRQFSAANSSALDQLVTDVDLAQLENKLLDPFENFDGLKAVGFNIEFHSESLASVIAESEEYVAEAELSNHLMMKVVPAVGRLVREHLQTAWTYPGKILILNSKFADIRLAGMQTIKADRAAWLAAKTSGGHFWIQLLKRSFRNWVIVEETMLLLEGCKWDMCDEVDTQLNRMSLHVGGAFAVVCCFQKAADHADRDNANKRLDGRKLWHTPIHENMLSTLFRFQEIDLAEIPDEVIPTTLEEAGLPESLFQLK